LDLLQSLLSWDAALPLVSKSEERFDSSTFANLLFAHRLNNLCPAYILLSSVVTNALLLTSCDLLDLSGGFNKGSLGLFQWNNPSDGKEDECFDFPPDEEREIEDKALKCAQVCAILALCFGGVLFVFGFFKQCIIPLPCSQRIMDLTSACVQLFLALVYVVWASKACDFYSCSYGDGATYLIVTQFLWLGAGCFSRCMRDGRWERRDEIKAQKELKKEEKARKAAEADLKKKEEAEAADARAAEEGTAGAEEGTTGEGSS
jgi:hypothetical protein